LSNPHSHSTENEARESVKPNIEKKLLDDTIDLDLRLGHIIKLLRIQNKLSQDELADAAGTSSGIIQQIENGQIAATLITMTNIADAFGITLSSLYRELESPIGGAQHIKNGEGMAVVRSGTKIGHTYELLSYSQGPHNLYEPFLIKMDDASEVFRDFSHLGTEFIYVLEGEMEYHHGEKTYLLKPGDTLSFAGEIPHGPEKLIQVPIKFLAIIIYHED